MFSYTIFIMLLPLLSFIILGLAGMKMQHKVAGWIGTCSLGLVTILSYLTAFQYFGADRVNGIYQTIVPYNFTWLPLGNLHFDLGILLDPISLVMLIVKECFFCAFFGTFLYIFTIFLTTILPMTHTLDLLHIHIKNVFSIEI